MFISHSNLFFSPFIFIICFILFVTIIFTPIILFPDANLISYSSNSDITYSTSDYFYWPTPDSKRITSFFGKRTSPTFGASSYHRGIDIGAPERN